MNRKLYKNPATHEVFEYAADGSQDAFILNGLIAMNAAEVEVHLNPHMMVGSAHVDAERDRRIDAGVTFQNVLFQSRATDRENIAGAAQLGFVAVVAGAQVGDLRWSDPNNDFTWIAADNSLVPMDAPTVVEFGRTVAQRRQALIFAGRQLKDMNPIPADYTDDKWWL
ncbi:DUF4376 domain-containing protein [Pseudomonas putida]|uniref:DUF4376 domain-containing protein n=1 Tax=Pseudomonas putida TaxID=303 RepID=A0A6S5TBU7_PSEPU|nr:DUF4376 domain-containing protein [Pseudomonas putida]BBT40868.1 hypothetical protein WP8W18C01_32090 [Pseudomonas putida]